MSDANRGAGQGRRKPWSWRRWISYFRHNADTLLPIAWHQGAALTEEERQAVLQSLLKFQQAKGLDGGHFCRRVQACGDETGDWDCVEAQRLFMAEEKRHGADLARVLEMIGVPRWTRPSWLRRLFCCVASLGSLELVLAVNLMAEVCSQACYGFLRRATGSRVLQQLCARVLHDEMYHVRFHCEALARLRRRRRGWLLSLTHVVDGLLFLGAGLMCWWRHKGVMQRAGVGFAGFWQQAHLHLFRASLLKDPSNYAWDHVQTKATTEPIISGMPILAGKP